MDEIKELNEKIKMLESKINLDIPKCLICHELVECPVTINGYFPTPVIGINSKNFSKCKSTISNPLCYRCLKKYLSSSGNTIYTKCLHNCCRVNKNSLYSYGEIGRSFHDLPEPTMWKALGNKGVTKCKDCKLECFTVYDLGKHIINDCPNRLVKCYSCKKDINLLKLKEHNVNCNIKCRFCKEILEPDDNKRFKDHFCKQKPLFKCLICNQAISRENLNDNTHINCSKIKYIDIIDYDFFSDDILRVPSPIINNTRYDPGGNRPVNNFFVPSRLTPPTESYFDDDLEINDPIFYNENLVSSLDNDSEN